MFLLDVNSISLGFYLTIYKNEIECEIFWIYIVIIVKNKIDNKYLTLGGPIIIPVQCVRVISSSFSRPQLIVPSPTPFWPCSSSSKRRKFRGTTETGFVAAYNRAFHRNSWLKCTRMFAPIQVRVQGGTWAWLTFYTIVVFSNLSRVAKVSPNIPEQIIIRGKNIDERRKNYRHSIVSRWLVITRNTAIAISDIRWQLAFFLAQTTWWQLPNYTGEIPHLNKIGGSR